MTKECTLPVDLTFFFGFLLLGFFFFLDTFLEGLGPLGGGGLPPDLLLRTFLFLVLEGLAVVVLFEASVFWPSPGQKFMRESKMNLNVIALWGNDTDAIIFTNQNAGNG